MQSQKVCKSTKNKEYKNKGICQIRAWELVFNDCLLALPLILKTLCSAKYGALKAFAVRHVKEKKTHVHIGLILRDKPQMKYTDIKEYFTVGKHFPQVREKLKNKSRDFDKKLQTYWNYCTDQEKHPDEDISVRALHKWKPKEPEEEKLKPADFMTQKVRDGMTVEELEDLIDDPELDLACYKEGLRNFDIYEKMINKHDEIRARKLRRKQYHEDVKSYRPFQTSLTKLMDDQNDREIPNMYEKIGKVGKNFWLGIENKRTDTLILSNAKTKSIAEAWNPRVHKRIIFDIPRGGAAYLNYKAIESLKNGQIFAEKYKSKPKCSNFKPSIMILTNEPVKDYCNWSADRLTEWTTSEANGFKLVKAK